MFSYEELAIPGQTETGKESSNPFMAGSLPKTIHLCDSLQSDEDSFELIELMILCTNFLTMMQKGIHKDIDDDEINATQSSGSNAINIDTKWSNKLLKTSHDIAPLPPRDQRHPWLRYQVEGYIEDIMHKYEQRPETIFGRSVNWVYVLDFAGLTMEMKQTLAGRLRMVYLGMRGRSCILAMHQGDYLRSGTALKISGSAVLNEVNIAYMVGYAVLGTEYAHFLVKFRPEYLRKPRMTNVVKLYRHHKEKRGFSGMLGSLDCTDWKWFGCLYGYKGQYVRRDNDRAPKIPFVANAVTYPWGYDIVDGIYPELATFVKTIPKLFDDDHNNVLSSNMDQSASNSLTNEKFKRLMALISDKTGSSSIPANITVDHPNGTKAIVTHVGSLRLTDKIVIHDVLVVPGYEANLLSVYKLSRDNKFRVLFYEDVCVIQDSV
nr:hypothetical protein [Tanacetum cinerariifolium]